jgi:hypothetical protein
MAFFLAILQFEFGLKQTSRWTTTVDSTSQEIPASYEIQWFITTFKEAFYWALPCICAVQPDAAI